MHLILQLLVDCVHLCEVTGDLIWQVTPGTSEMEFH